MYKFKRDEIIDNIQGALSLRPQIEKIVDEVYQSGFKNICWLGIGGTYASCLQAQVHMKEKSGLEIIVENAAEYLATGNRRIGKGTFVIISSVTGRTQEMVDALREMKTKGVRVLGFIDKKDTPLSEGVDDEIAYPVNEQLKFLMVANRFLYLEGVLPEYEDIFANYEAHLAQALIQVSEKADAFGQEFAKKHCEDAMHYFVGAGNQYGGTYSYAMCFWEEQHWLRSKSIHSAEFFHGMFEIVDKNTAVTLFVGEDSQRCLSIRVAEFLPQICGNYTVIDTKDYELKGIKEDYRGAISHIVMRMITERIDVYIEKINCHPMDIRRYYRQLPY